MNSNLECVNSIFEQPWWLDAVAEGKWAAIELKNKSDKIYARFPYAEQRRFGIKVLTNPVLTQTLGIYIEDTGAKITKKLERQKKLINELLDQIPPKMNVDIMLDTNCDYILPFIWKRFKVMPRISYRLDDLSDCELIWKGFRENIKTDIKKAQRNVEIKDDLPITVLAEVQKKTFARQGRKSPYSLETLKKIDRTLREHNACKLLCAVDCQGNVHAAAYFIFDSERCYYLMSGGDPGFRNSGAGALLVWEGIKFASKVSKVFDFEGSMIEDIERFFRAFGARPHVYYRITRLNFVLSFLEMMKPKVKRLLNYK